MFGSSLAPGAESTSTLRYVRIALICCIAMAIAGGIFLRFADLGGKFYYEDEVASSLHESGKTAAQFFSQFFDGHAHPASAIVSYVQDHTGSPLDTVRALVYDDPQHPPLFYLANQYWTDVVGRSIADQRSLAALFGAAALVAVFWFGTYLYRSVATACILTAIVAVSPFHVIYSQQNREYSTWFFFLALCSALLLRALDKPSIWRWVLYGIVLELGFYTSALFLLDAISFAIYVGLAERRYSKRVVGFVVSTGTALAGFIPWLIVMYRGSTFVLHWQGPALHAVSAKVYLLKWLFNSGAVFFDMEYERAFLIPILLVILILIVISVAALAKAPLPVKLYVISISIVPLAAFVVHDALHKESYGTYARYLIPLWFGYEVAMAYFIGLCLSRSLIATRIAGAAVFLLLVTSGIASAAKDDAAQQTWVAAHMARLGVFGHVINADAEPLVVYVHDGSHWDISVAGLATVLRPGTRLQLFADIRNARPLEPGFFLFNATEGTREQLQRTMRGRWREIEAGMTGPALVRQLQIEAASNRAGHFTEGDESPLWEHLPET
jgi:uncharacterized membrane protein